MMISVIGIGAMGRPIARNLLKVGHSVCVYNRTPGRGEALREDGAMVATSVARACKAEVSSITVLADDAAVEAVIFESKEFFARFGPDQVHICMPRRPW